MATPETGEPTTQKDGLRLLRVAAVLLVLFGPVLVLLLMRGSNQQFVNMPILGERTLQGTDTLYYTVPAPLADSLKGRMHLLLVVAADSVTQGGAKGVVGELTHDFAYAWHRTGDIRLVLAGAPVAAEYDTVPGLRLSIAADSALRSAYLLTKPGMRLPAALVDPDFHVRAVYDAASPGQVKRLKEDVRALRHEFRQKQVTSGRYSRFVQQ